nr:uncharacterized protein LOC123753771 [Procambarus clarkii]
MSECASSLANTSDILSSRTQQQYKYESWERVAETHRVNFTDCPCIGNASFNLASIILDDAHNITSVSVTTSYGNQSTLLKNATIHVGLTMTKSDPIVANLSNTPSSFTKQTFNVTAYGKHVTLIRWDNIPLCVCYLGAKGY